MPRGSQVSGLLAALAVSLVLVASASAQTTRLPSTGMGGPTVIPQLPGTGGPGAPDLSRNLRPDLTPSLGGTAAPPLPDTTQAQAPVAAQPAFRFRCEVAPQASACREMGAPDGGGDDADCICSRDPCHDEVDPTTSRLMRICEKR